MTDPSQPRVPAGVRTGGQFSGRSRAEAALNLDQRLGPRRDAPLSPAAERHIAEQAQAWAEKMTAGIADAPAWSLASALPEFRTTATAVAADLARARLEHDAAAVERLERRNEHVQRAMSTLNAAALEDRLGGPARPAQVTRVIDRGAVLTSPETFRMQLAWFEAAAHPLRRRAVDAVGNARAHADRELAADLTQRRDALQGVHDVTEAAGVMRAEGVAERSGAAHAAHDAAFAYAHADLVDDPRLCTEGVGLAGERVRTGWTRQAYEHMVAPWETSLDRPSGLPRG
ncbi:hypothetical protein [Cellulosimicrobium sp. Marseille-Q4280]|uniref:hypothetical protein n=1 Tax=Cellulosimicrobium sp. Marseille-Q4280 TaxID=2937992 RepID=UPI00204236F2|nr:hypothetical protein [Cellulosimicrobium sp. Marseille-Q4280]